MSRFDRNNPEMRRRLEELLVDDALGELEGVDLAELAKLDVKGNPFHSVVAAVGEAIVPSVAMPMDVQKSIEAAVPMHLRVAMPARQASVQANPMRIGTWAGWVVAAAACIALVFALRREQPAPQVVVKEVIREVPAPVPPTPTPAEALASLIESDKSVIKAAWGKGNTADAVAGQVVWSPIKQSGFMRLTGLPALPAGLQYQLWIIDAGRPGSAPIDGGVFDISSNGEVIVPFNAKLKVNSAAAFAITVEKEGGVVESKQEKVAALAKPA